MENLHKLHKFSQSGEGNTSPLRGNERCRKWVFTLNNYEDEIFTHLHKHFQENCLAYIIGKEVGENNTPHLQGYMRFKDAVSFSKLKKLCNRWHLEKAKGTDIENYNYCSKDGLFYTNIHVPKPIKKSELWLKWQFDLKEELIMNEPDDRKIYWYWSNEGNKGKSSFVKHMIDYHNSGFINKGKYSDMINQIYNYEHVPEIILIDIPRCMNKISYSALEDIKNGLIANSKYETGFKRFNPPHIVVFCNFEPDDDIFSSDRLIIRNID